MKIDDIVSQIQTKEPATSFIPVKPEWIDSAAKRFPGMPDDLRQLYLSHGYGRIGDSRYMIHCLLEPDEIFDPETARALDGVLIVGDDFAGHCEAYDASDNWRFGSVGSDGNFEPYDGVYSSFTDFLEKWFVADEDT
ncbi:MAG: SMI1/KNR4 family protein [Pirellulaceae bacterium]